MDDDKEKRFVLIVNRSELNAILKALKSRKRWMETSLEKKNTDNPHIEGIKESIEFNGMLTRKLLYQKTHSRLSDYK